MAEDRNALDAGGQFLTEVRDLAIMKADAMVQGRMPFTLSNGSTLPAVFTGTQKEALLEFVPEVVDSVLHFLLSQLEWSECIRLEASVGDRSFDLAEISDGLAGELYTSTGWIARFSQQRHNQ